MKRIIILFILALCCLNMSNLMAQKKKAFAGTVKYAIKYEGDIDPQDLAKAPTEISYLVAGNNTKVTRDLGGAFRHDITIGDSGKTIILFDIPGQKMAVVVTKEESEDGQKAYKYDIVDGNETKEVCGFVCKRYDVTITNIEEENETKLIVYTSDAIGLDEKINFDIPGLKGFPLYRTIEGKTVKTTYEAVEVRKKKVSPAEFMIPEGYQDMTVEEFQQLLESAGGQGEE